MEKQVQTTQRGEQNNNLLNRFSDLTKNFLHNEQRSQDPNLKEADRAKFDHVKDYLDTDVYSGDLVGYTKNARPINITARDATFEPMLMERLFAVHAPYKRTITPQTNAFDASGNVTIGGTSYTSYSFASLTNFTPAFIGWAFRLKVNNREVGSTSFRVTNMTTNLVADFSLDDINKEAVVVVLNHSVDTSITDSFAQTGTTNAYEPSESSAEASQQFYFDYSANRTWKIEGTNVIVYAYPILVTRDINALIYASIMADDLGNLPTLLASMYTVDK